MSNWVKTEQGWKQTGGNAKNTAVGWEGTTEQFELEKDNISDGTLINITDDTQSIGDINGLLDAINGDGVIQQEEIYDDTERVIGTWFGKPLYRKCFSGIADFLANSLVDVPHNITNIGDTISIHGGIDNGADSNNTQYPIPYVNGSPGDALWNFGVWTNNTNIRLRSSQEKLNRKYWVILEYTKAGE